MSVCCVLTDKVTDQKRTEFIIHVDILVITPRVDGVFAGKYTAAVKMGTF